MARLTPKFVETAKAEKKRQEIPDDSATGLYLIIHPTGAKAWAARYRADGKSVKYSLGRFPRMSLPQARLAMADIRNKVANGADPAEDRRAAKVEMTPDFLTVGAVFKDYEQKKLAHMKSGGVTGRELQRHVIDQIGDRDIKAIRRRDVFDLLDHIAQEGRIPTANRTRAYLSAFLGWAADRELIASNPAAKIKPFGEERSRERVLTDDELRAYMSAADSVPSPWGEMAWLLLLTGQRLSEVAGMRTDEIVFGSWHIPAWRVKNNRSHIVPLSKQAQVKLEGLPLKVIEGQKCKFYMTTTGVGPVSGFAHAKAIMNKKMGDIPHWTFHDVRRTLATRFEGMGVPISVTEAVLNHVSGSKDGIVGVYQRHQYFSEKREALDAWAVELERIKGDV
ncbi:site-specific integrase [uncultured Sulfitobacter sp.]|uniref:tyrosine-type recombinase/integrase n=1 Tax=uncultured Sulfitobacter sp. TaxID=191468 RepID=UPI00262F7B9D|nr:site-specific integrase [uncultured Sulfitobacter sp.]